MELKSTEDVHIGSDQGSFEQGEGKLIKRESLQVVSLGGSPFCR